MIEIINEVAPKYGIPVELMVALGQQESGLNPNAVGDGGWSHGAWQIYLKAHTISKEQAHDPQFSTDYAAQFLSRLYKQHGNWPDALAAYNSGKPLAQAPASTQQYVRNILGGSAGATQSEGAVGTATLGRGKISGPKPTFRTPTIKVSKPKAAKVPKIGLKMNPLEHLPKPFQYSKIEAPRGSKLYRLTTPTAPPQVGIVKVKMPKPQEYKVGKIKL